MEKTIVFIHGMFLNSKSWNPWISHFEQQGYTCIAPSWPLHEGEPSDLRKNIPDGLGKLHLHEIINKYTDLINGLPEKPILIGHSVGGLIVQLLLSKELGEMGISICPVAPNKMLSLDFNLFKNVLSIVNPLKKDEPYIMSPEAFYETFCNTMRQDEALNAYHEFATHDSRNVLRDCMKDIGKIDLNRSHAPLLFLAADEDRITPASLVRKNFEAYKDSGSRKDYNEFISRSHFMCAEPGYREVINYCSNWIDKVRNLEILEVGHS
jgi:pimeloyl-ACP methyl ester carboxylesterase